MNIINATELFVLKLLILYSKHFIANFKKKLKIGRISERGSFERHKSENEAVTVARSHFEPGTSLLQTLNQQNHFLYAGRANTFGKSQC